MIPPASWPRFSRTWTRVVPPLTDTSTCTSRPPPAPERVVAHEKERPSWLLLAELAQLRTHDLDQRGELDVGHLPATTRSKRR